MSAITANITNTKYPLKTALVFLFYWAVLFVIYLPAANAGRVGDFPGWVEAVTSRSFFDYINRAGSGIPSMYQFTQVVTWLFYQAFGPNAWLWHLLHLGLQAINAVLLFLFFSRLFEDALVRNAGLVAFCGALLFCVCPHISEVVVWEPSFHYLQGLLLMLVVLICAQRFITTQKNKYAWYGGVVFFLSTYSLEVFYLTPLFVFLLGLHYYFVLRQENGALKKLLLCFSLPQVILFMLHLVILRVLYGQGIAHVGSSAIQLNEAIFSKPLKYIYHILFFGRFFGQETRQAVYRFCESGTGISLFYGITVAVSIYVATRFSRLNTSWKTTVLLFIWAVFALGLILPLWLPDTGLVIYDRYTYVLDAFVYLLLALVLGNFCGKYVFIAIIGLYALVNYRFTHKVVAYWQQSADIVNNLLATFPNDPSKKVLLLSLPECLDGVQMVGTRDDGEFRMMYNAVMRHKITNPVYDVEAFYLRSPADGAHVMVVNDSTIRVTLNQWGTWWLYYGYGAASYENSDYKVDMRDVGHWYDVILKHPSSEYLLLYSIGRDWKIVDMNKKNIDQY